MDAGPGAATPPRPGAAGSVSAGGLFAAAGRLWCLVGHHVPAEGGVWHQGYGFARCRRCDQAIVRSLLSDWTVPGPGLRVVWDKPSGRPVPAAGPAASTAPVVVAAPSEGRSGETPAAQGNVADGPVAADARAPTQPATVVADAPGPETAPLLTVLAPEPAPIDLLGPNFMGAKDPPPVVRDGSNMFEFEDMTDENGGVPDFGGVAAQKAS